MTKYIDCEALLEQIADDDPSDVSFVATIRDAKKAFRAIISDFPAADVVEVVRCKNCQHGRPIDKTKSPEKYFKDDCIVCECENVVGEEPMVYLPSHFCSYGINKRGES